ncbi:M20/M25/M40 family metallo-hydrolase [Asaia bogorensis]|uniref:M20/M25/M40 family metallo-hydrolase n=1 Tax=Asaia bogorensis TaxID=91915 RepID=UPI000EFC4C8F|nr:M20/M25/M40 family metallo-hydrolase [Asaia bogorensis]
MIKRAILLMLLLHTSAWDSEPARAEPLPALTRESLQTLELARSSIALHSVAGTRNETPAVADLYRRALISGGFAASSITITQQDGTAFLALHWQGRDPALKPLLILGHMDVVAANPSDWQHDPFTPVTENGYLYGRGASDMKMSNALAITSLIHLRQQGFVPDRGIILALSGDEETEMKTGQALARIFANAGKVLNLDVGGGVLDEETNRPVFYTWSGAEKTYADIALSVSDPGGHSSEPRSRNAIDVLAEALLKIQAHPFRPELNALTRSYFMNAARFSSPRLAAAMRVFAATPDNARAVAILRAEPSLVGSIGTTCTVTTIRGGHALNALPQHAEANINCRIFPGHSRIDVMHELAEIIDDPSVHLEDQSAGSVETPPSPLDAPFAAAVTRAAHAAYPDVPVFPSMSSGASDSMWFRAIGVPSYGVCPIFMKSSDNFAHGLNERVPLSAITPGLHFLLSLIPALSGP